MAKIAQSGTGRLRFVGFLLGVSTMLVFGCSSSEPTQSQTNNLVDSTVLGSGVSDNQSWSYELLRVTVEDGTSSYMQWFPSASSSPRGVLILANPYQGIDWSGELVDQRWGMRTGGIKYPDDEEPNFNSETSSDIFYQPIAANMVANGGYLSLAKNNNLNVLVVFGRFYAGGSLWNDAQDMRAGLQYLSTRTDIDKNRIGLFGVSWGAYQAVYATAYRPDDVTPVATVAVAPATDIEKFVEHVSSIDLLTSDPLYPEFYEPYLRRIAASSGGDLDGKGGDFGRFINTALADKINTPLLIIHDEWDTLIPVRESCELSIISPNVEALWYQHVDATIDYDLPARKLNHGPLGAVEGTSVPTDYTWSMLYLLSKLNDPADNIVILYDANAMRNFFQNIYALQFANVDVDWLLNRLLELSDSRVTMFDGVCSIDCLSGSEFLATEFNNVWGTQLDSNTVIAQLTTTGIPSVTSAATIQRCQ